MGLAVCAPFLKLGGRHIVGGRGFCTSFCFCMFSIFHNKILKYPYPDSVAFCDQQHPTLVRPPHPSSGGFAVPLLVFFPRTPHS